MLFVPLGIYVALLNRNKSILVNTLLVSLCSVLVEVTQYVLAVGSADIDDVIVKGIVLLTLPLLSSEIFYYLTTIPNVSS